MKTKVAPAMTVLSYELKTNLKSLNSIVGIIPKEIYKEVVKADFLPAGPQYWIYKWDDHDPNSDFILKIAIPVVKTGSNIYSGKFKLEKLDSFKCISAEHIGAWDKLKETYSKIKDNINSEGLILGLTSREVYLNCDFENIENNVTEIQFELVKL